MIKHILKTFLFILLLFTLPLKSLAQAPFPKWVDDFGGSGDSKPTGMVVDKQNNIYISGYFAGTVDFDPSTGVKNLTSVGGYDIFVGKYKPDGTLIWAESMGGNALDQVNCMSVDKDGNPTIIGQFQSSNLDADPGPGVYALSTQAGDDIFIIHLDTNGAFLWAKDIGGTGTDRGEEVSADAQDDVIATAIFSSTFSLGGTTIGSASSSFNGLVIKYDPAGNLMWYIDLKGTGDTEVYGNGVDSNGDIVVSGSYSGSIDFDPLGAHKNMNSGGSGFVAKYDPSGKLIWVNTVSGSYVNNGSAVSIDSKNDVFITAAFTSKLVFNGTSTLNPSGQDIFLAKYNSAGAFQFATDLGGIGATGFPYQIRNDSNNNVYITGYFSGTIDFNSAPGATANVSYHGQRDFFLAKFDQNGNYVYAFSGGSPNCNLTLGIEMAIDNNNNVDLAGSFCSTVNFDASGCSSRNVTAINGVTDTFIAQYVPPSTSVTTNNVITGPAVTSFCGSGTPGAITGSNPSGGNGTYTYQWQNSTDSINFTDIANAVSKNYSPPLLNATKYYRRMVSAPCALPLNSDIIGIKIQPVLANNTIAAPAVTSFCGTGTPDAISGNTPTGGNGVFVYQWQSSTDNINFTNIVGATTKNYTPASISKTTWYRRTVTSGACTTPLVSNVVQLSTIPPVSNNVITAPSVTDFCVSGTPGTITGSVPSGGNGSYAYQWQSSTDNINFTDIPGATAENYTPPAISTSTWFRRTANSGVCTMPQVSNKIEIVITPAIANNVTTAPQVASFCASGNPLPITGSTPTGGTGAYSYQWQSSTDNVNFIDINGATLKSYDPSSLNASTWYRRLVTSGVCTIPLISNIVEITIISSVANNTISAPQITAFCSTGDPATITGSIPTGGDGIYIYQWQSSTDNATFSDINGATSINYNPPPLTVNTWYRRAVTSGVCIVPLISNVIEITITPLVANNIITVPSIAAFCGSGDPLPITGSTPTGGSGNYTYQWQNSTDSVNFADINGATLKNYDPPSVSVNTYYRRNVISGVCAAPFGSNVVTIQITSIPATPVPVAASVAVCPGSAASLSVFSPVQGLTYNWYDSATKINRVFTGVTYVTGPINSAQTFYVEATNGTCSSPSLAGVEVTLNSIPAAPVVNNEAACDGSSVTLNIVNPQAGYTYNWYAAAGGGSLLATGTSFTTPAVTTNITYYAEAANSTGCISLTRTTVNVTDNPLPVITVQNKSVCPGLPATLTASSTDNNVVINWYAASAGGSILFTGTSFTIAALNANTTYYTEAVDNVTGCSSPVRIAVVASILQPLAAPAVTVGPTTTSTITFDWTAVPGATGYEVSVDNGKTFTAPSTGSSGLSHIITGLQYKQSVTVIVRAVGAQPCELSASSTAVTAQAINPTSGDIIYVPNAFTPNGDGKNDQVHVHSESIRSLSFYVYDQWGELIYTTNEQQNGWDGTFKGKKEPAGVYVYYLEAVMNDGEKLTKKGTITLLR